MKYKDQVDIPKAIKADKSLLVTMTLKLWETLVIQVFALFDSSFSTTLKWWYLNQNYD